MKFKKSVIRRIGLCFILPTMLVGMGFSLVYFLVTEFLLNMPTNDEKPEFVFLAFGGLQINLFIYFLVTGSSYLAWFSLCGPTAILVPLAWLGCYLCGELY
jgi:hypothetical protein